jgi:hypothetical protein
MNCFYLELLTAGANPNTYSQEGMTPLHEAAGYCSYGAVEKFLNWGANIAARTQASSDRINIRSVGERNFQSNGSDEIVRLNAAEFIHHLNSSYILTSCNDGYTTGYPSCCAYIKDLMIWHLERFSYSEQDKACLMDTLNCILTAQEKEGLRLKKIADAAKAEQEAELHRQQTYDCGW